MQNFLVAGLINVETTLQVDGFPIHYHPVRFPFFGINSSISGVGYNVAKALVTLGNSINFAALIGQDMAGQMVRDTLAKDRIPGDLVIDALAHTPQSVILFDKNGKRQIHVDLKDIQERHYPEPQFEEALQVCSVAVLCNINFARPYLKRARELGKLVATDVHTIADLDDEYNRDYMAAADILFMSDEHLPCPPEEWARRVVDRFGTEIVVIGLGAQGALLAVKRDHFVERISAVMIRPVINTIGAGDALFSCFLHSYQKSGDPYKAIQKAMIFASYKIGEHGAADGFLDEAALNSLCEAQNA